MGHPQTLFTMQVAPRDWAWGQGPGSTSGMTVKIVSHVEFTMRARGAQGRCESPGLRSELPPSLLQRQEVPYGKNKVPPSLLRCP